MTIRTSETDPVMTLADARGLGGRVLRAIERVGNRLPHPLYLFLIVAGLVAAASAVAAAFGVTTTDPATGDEVAVQSILSVDGLGYVVGSAIENFVLFPPFGLVITVMLGIGVAERLGMLQAFMRAAVLSAPRWAVTFVVVVVSLMGNLASDSASLILPPLAAAAFLTAGRHPLAGFVASFSAVAAGFSANLVPAGTDVLLSGITTSAAQIVDPDAHVSVLSNWYFMSASTIVLAVVITIVCQVYVEPRLGTYSGVSDPSDLEPMTSAQRKGLVAAALAGALTIALFATALLWPGSPLRGEGGAILRSPFMSNLPLFLMLFFLATAVSYGVTAGTLKSANDIPRMMVDSVRELAPFIVVMFAAAQAIAWFDWTNLGIVLATVGADGMAAAGIEGIWGLVLLSLFVIVPALLLSSGSALWTLLAPIFVPMFMLGGVDPAYVQAAFRITDSATNPLSPFYPMMPVVLGLMQRYAPKAGFGTLFSLILPFTVAVWITWTLLFIAWGLLGLPVGPSHSLML
ncbi:p-aminobenzoyl-glutamate transporter [Microbacterium barkeri]|uniref:p-aminobenzoyl-glutamate transporter n=1 Tax=Microbacterium barkeri TaxID=33917 RepID=A0A9W6LWP0_9MICO|nr:AbgT family transporter [Microbacterium barkeri]MDI6943400.1 AbgT family transporter [Microbacterium barkeri]MDR6878209.1 aminobenzoyl-glutamate transport protein [Microbacterium barkeri]GLJ61405.1 p-aminobenzoyl-glutamate transporter [Microbacterium barkeri]